MKKHTTMPLVGVFLLLIFSSCMAEKKPEQAWWLKLSITPDKTLVNGINIGAFNKSWKYANILDSKLISKSISNNEYNELKKSNFKLKVEQDLNHNKINEVIKVGIYLDHKNTKGIFLAVFENTKLIKVFTDSTNKGFSALVVNNKNIRWYKCMNCGEYEEISWNGKSYTIQ